MSEQTLISHPKEHVTCTYLEGFNALSELALDMRWSWNHATDHAMWFDVSRDIEWSRPIIASLKYLLSSHVKHGVDMPEIRNWKWPDE